MEKESRGFPGNPGSELIWQGLQGSALGGRDGPKEEEPDLMLF